MPRLLHGREPFFNAAIAQPPLVPDYSGCLSLTSDSRLLMDIPNGTIITLKLFSYAPSSFDLFYVAECQSMSPFFALFDLHIWGSFSLPILFL